MLSTPGGKVMVRVHEAVLENIGQHDTLCPQSGNREQIGSACPSDSLLPVWPRLLKGPQPLETVPSPSVDGQGFIDMSLRGTFHIPATVEGFSRGV